MAYAVCWVEGGSIYSCGHEHESIADAMTCLAPRSGEFIRACESGIYRSLNEREVVTFLTALRDMPWMSPRMILEME
jgi:hypothetical protein